MVHTHHTQHKPCQEEGGQRREWKGEVGRGGEIECCRQQEKNNKYLSNKQQTTINKGKAEIIFNQEEQGTLLYKELTRNPTVQRAL